MHNYEALRETWIYQEIKEEVQAEVRQQHITALCQILLAIIQVRFPRLEIPAKRVTEHVTEPASLQTLLVKISTARSEKEARQGLSEVCQVQLE